MSDQSLEAAWHQANEATIKHAKLASQLQARAMAFVSTITVSEDGKQLADPKNAPALANAAAALMSAGVKMEADALGQQFELAQRKRSNW